MFYIWYTILNQISIWKKQKKNCRKIREEDDGKKKITEDGETKNDENEG